MRQAIETAPRDGNVVILENDATGTYDVAHWSAEAGVWVTENNEPSKITPTHWHPMPRDKYRSQEDQENDKSSGRSRAGLPAPRARRHHVFPSSSKRAAPRDVIKKPPPIAKMAPITVAAAKAQTVSVETRRAWPARRRFAASSIAATLVAAAITGTYFPAEVADPQGTFEIGSLGGQTAAQKTQSPNQASQNQASPSPKSPQANSSARDIAALQRQAGAQGQEAAQVEPAEAPAPEARHSLEKQILEEAQLPEVSADEVALARRLIDGRGQQWSALSEVELEQERAEVAALISSAQQELTASSMQHRQALAEERARGATLASELAMARRDIGTKVALLSKVGDEAAQPKQAADATAAKLRQSLQQERDKAAAMASELATARRDIETKAALSSKSGDDAAQLRQAADAKATELGQSLQQARDKATALASELASARRDIEAKAALSNKAGDETAQLRQAAEATAAELRQSLQQERDKAAALARDLESAQRVIDARKAERTASSRIDQVNQVHAAEAAAAEPPAAAEAQSSPEAARLMARAGALLAQGNIGAARIVLERAAETGSADASYALAETYDPAILSSWGTYGTRGDATKARELYAKAQAGGIQEAKDRFNALR